MGPLIFRDEIKFVADVAVGTGKRGNCDGAAARIEIVPRRGQPVAYECLFELPAPGGFLLHSGAELLEIAPSDHIREPELVMIGRIELIKGAPPLCIRAICSGGIVDLREDPRFRERSAEG